MQTENVLRTTDDKVLKPIESIVIYEHEDMEGKKQQLILNQTSDSPVHLKGWELVKKRELITFGISIGNGYFSKKNLNVLISGFASYFAEVIILIPDLPALHSYRAIGYTEDNAYRAMKKHRGEVLSHCKAIFKLLESKLGRLNVKFFLWSDGLTETDYYQKAYQEAIEIYHQNQEFRKAIRYNTERYILARLGNCDIQQIGGIEAVVNKAIFYLLEEVAFHRVFDHILGREAISSYYKELELAINYVEGKYNNVPNPHVGWTLYNIIDVN